MTESVDARAKRIIDKAFDLAGPARAALLDRECADDPQLRARVESLLAAIEKDDPFLSDPTVGSDEPPVRALGEQPGDRIGPYKLLELIGEGGFGSVFMAEQTDPIYRRVALKIIKLGMDTRAVVARFEQERQALALMDHPNIARVLDAGATPAGRPYFVMELVRGEPITAFCDAANLAVRQRLEVFTQVCRAVQHAHTKGIIHRDIKPSNVLVSTHDDRPLCKIIDFGIVKATQRPLIDKTVFTEFRQLIGTPAYMSPEQAVGSLDIDTRADVYSLGVLLYELLTGTTPFDGRKLLESGHDALVRTIRDQDPPRPSFRLATLASSSIVQLDVPPRARSHPGDSSIVEIARRRRSEPMPLTRLVRGDLDWIVMHALDRDRARRYESPGDLAADIERYLAGEPIEAKRDSLGYVLRKRLRRHWLAATIATGFLVLLGAGFVVSLSLWRQAARALTEAESQRRIADRRAEETEKVARFQSQMLSKINLDAMGSGIKKLFREQLASSLGRESIGSGTQRRKRTPEEIGAVLATFDSVTAHAIPVDVARRVMDRFILRDAADAAMARFANQPRVEAELLYAVGDTSAGLGLFDEAEPYLRLALKLRRAEFGERSRPVAECLAKLAAVVNDKGKPAAAESLAQEAIDIYRNLSGARSVDVANGLVSMAQYRSEQGALTEAEDGLREALEIYRSLQGDESPEIAAALSALGCTLQSKGEYDAAEPLFEQAVRLSRKLNGDESYLTAHYMQNFAALLHAKHDLTRAEAMFRDALTRLRKTSGEDAPEYVTACLNLAVVLNSQQRYAESEPVCREALAQFRKLYGDEDMHVASAIQSLASSCRGQGRDAEAEHLLREALALNIRLFGHDDRSVAVNLTQLGILMARRSNWDEAETLYREALSIFEKLLGNQHPDVASVRLNLGHVLYAKHNYSAAEPLIRASLKVLVRRRGATDADTLDARISLARTIIKLTKPLHGDEPSASSRSADALVARLGEAEKLLLSAQDVYSIKPDSPPRHFPTLCDGLVELYETWNLLAPGEGFDLRAAQCRQKLEQWRASTQPVRQATGH